MGRPQTLGWWCVRDKRGEPFGAQGKSCCTLRKTLEDADFGDYRDQLGDVDFDFGTLAFVARDVQVEVRAVEHAEALADVAEANAFDVNVWHFFFGDTDAVIFDFDVQPAIAVDGSNENATPFELRRQAVFETVFDNGLQEHARDKRFQRVFADFLDDVEVVFAEAGDFDVEIVVDKGKFFAEGYERLVLAKQAAKNVAQFEDHAAGGVRVHSNERGDRVEGVEEKVRIDLTRERVHAGTQEQLLVALEIHFDAGVVPDLQRGSDGHERAKDNETELPIPVRIERKEPSGLGGHDQSHAAEFQAYAGHKRQHFPHHFATANHAHDGFGNVQEGEGAEIPEVFFVRDELSDQTADEAGGRGRRHGEPLMGHQRGDGNDGAANRADDAPAEESHEKSAFEGKIGELVGGTVQAKDDPDQERGDQEEHEFDFLVRIPLFGEEHAAEGVPASEQGGDRGGDTHLEEKGEEKLADAQSGLHLTNRENGPMTTRPYCKEIRLEGCMNVDERSTGRNSPPCYTGCSMAKKNLQNGNHGGKRGEARLVAQAELPTRYGRFRIYGFEGDGPREEAVALVRGNLNGRVPPLVRVHSQCLTGDVLHSLRCDCRAQLELSLKKIRKAPSGILLYLPQEGRGIGLMNKLRAYELQDGGMDTVEANVSLGFAADAREYEFPAKILKRLGATKIRLLSNNPDKVKQLESAGVNVLERVPCEPRISKISRGYLRTKKSKMGHLLQGV